MSKKQLFHKWQPQTDNGACTDHKYAETKQWILNTIAEFEQQSIAYEINIKSYLQLILVHLTRHHISQETVSQKYIRQTEKLKPLFTHLETAFAHKISVEQAAGLVNLSPHRTGRLLQH